MCRLLPLWTRLLEELGCEVLWVLLTRHPAENMRSLEKRDGFSAEKSALLWLQHTLDAERETRGRARVAILYDQLFEGMAATIGRVRAVGDLQWPVPPGEAIPRMAEFLDAGKRHHHASHSEDLPPWVRETYEGMQAGAAGDEIKMQELLGPALDAFDAADAFYRPVIRNQALDLENALAEANAELARISDAHAATKEKYRIAKEKLAAKSAELQALTQRLRQLERSPGGKINRVLNRLKPKKEA
jgi:hypothetical protein